MKKTLQVITILIFQMAGISALEVDEKLTLRILSLSSSKKTMLINRGIEDGLLVGDHAKMFLTTGVVARAVVVKVSPTRSVWSVYRFINKKAVTVDRVLNLKISTPVRITEDESKAIAYQEDRMQVDNLPTPVERKVIRQIDYGYDSDKKLDMADRQDLSQLEGPSTDSGRSNTRHGSFKHKSMEISLGLAFESLSGNYEISTESNSSPYQSDAIDIKMGLEKYFPQGGKMFKQVSLGVNLHYKSTSISSTTGGVTSTTNQDWLDFGINGAWHFGNSVFSYNRLIGYVPVTFGIGNLTIGNTAGEEAGTTSFYSAGVGAKYYLRYGIGIRFLINYYAAKNSFAFDDDSTRTVTQSGPQVEIAFSYRW